MSRVDTETDRRLPDGHAAARARPRSPTPSSRTSCSSTTFAGARWDALAAKGARVQRPLWASTSTKNPAYSPTLYVDELIGRDTVNTLAQASIDALAGGEGDLRADTVPEDVDGARAGHRRPRRARASTSTTSPRRSSAKASTSFAESFNDALATLEKKAASSK